VIDSFLDLREGDLVVHLAHGIGRYRGLKLIERHGQHEEHLEIEFDGGTKIYVPAVKIDLVQKYVGGTKTRPTLAKIGGKSWLRQKKEAEAAVHDLAVEMLEMQAIRRSRPGISFGNDSEWQGEFDHSFPYQETPDQLAAIAAIKDDMLGRGRWTVCSAATWASARRKSPCGPRSRRSITATRWRSSYRRPF
jgi:transcription-repair coupling factor (superfamily II helicase)